MSLGEADREFQPSRLTLARERRGLTKEDLAKACGVTRRTVTDWEAGKVQMPPLEALADATDFPIEFFFEELTDKVTVEHASFRALTSLSARQTKMVLANATIVQALSSWIDHKFETPPVDLPWLDQLVAPERESDPDPFDAAESMRAIWGLGAKPIRDLTALLESKGVRVFALNADAREVDAFSLWLNERPTIFLNCDKSAERLRFDLAHELGHLVMHRGVPTVGARHYEVAANAFASTLLMPSKGLMAQVQGHLTLETVLKLKVIWRVSATAMVFRLHQLKLINDWQYRNWMVDLSKRGYRRTEPDGLHPERSELLSQVMRLAREDGLSNAKLAKSLRMPLEDLTGAVGGLTMTAVA